MNKKFKSDMLEAIYEEAVSMFEVGAISEERMREYDRDCLVPEYAASFAATRAAMKDTGSSLVLGTR
jgi:DNA-binding transcriptional regulator YiaG